jgi:prepilin-type N-terminal cleavage/methylation domain-containing protein
MSFQFVRPNARGFTLIELLIVVIILAILAAIAIPQFSASSSDAQLSALDSNLSAVRTSIEQYRVQHNNVFPGSTASSAGAGCAGGVKGTGAANTAQALINQMAMPSDAAGNTCSIPDAVTYRFGPYLRQGIPNEPINGAGALPAAIAVTNAGSPIAAAANGTGWAYDTVSGQFIMNSAANDRGSPVRAYSAH